jgi:ABC-type transport system involved in cytochrome bd biosynthesis fused ATPase/permease subunit
MAIHSIEYLHLFDKIILLQHGKIIEIGTYE